MKNKPKLRMHCFKKALFAMLAFALTACTSYSRLSSSTIVKQVNYYDAAMHLRSAGDHLNASYYFEAALADVVKTAPESEEKILRLLVEEQIRSGRLLAAQTGLSRLKEISSNDATIQILEQIIALATGRTNATRKELKDDPERYF